MKEENINLGKKYHQWVQVEAGGVFPNSWSFQKCKKCGAVVTHYYQRESFSEALKREGLTEFCEKGRRKLKN